MLKKLIASVGLAAGLLCASAAEAQTRQNVPPPWQWADIGAVGTPGHVQGNPIDFDWFAEGAGGDIWGTADSFLYAYQPLRDGSVVTSVVSQSATHPFAKAGVMIRQTLDPGSPQVILDVKPDGGIEFMTRATPGGETTFIAGAAAVPPTEVALYLIRSGDLVSASFCFPSTCTQLGSVQSPAGEVLAGLAVTSHDPSTLNHVHFGPPYVLSLPNPWDSFDVRDLNSALDNPGYATYEEATGTFFVSGAGSDIWGASDSFFMVNRQPVFAGPTTALTARVVSEGNTHPFAKAGLVMNGASFVDPMGQRVILDVKPDGGLEFMARLNPHTPMTFLAGASASFPVWLRLTRNGSDFTGEWSADGETWTVVGTVAMSMPVSFMTGFAVTSHDPNVFNTARFDNVALTAQGVVGQNLLLNAGFEESVVPNAGPGWVSDAFRQSPAVSETAAPRSGTGNGACRTTSLDCGIYQDVTVSRDASYGVSIYARADHPGALVGVNINGQLWSLFPVLVGGYQNYTSAFPGRHAGDVVRVWMYAPSAAGFVVIDDAVLAELPAPPF